jgi:hypothetical protein
MGRGGQAEQEAEDDDSIQILLHAKMRTIERVGKTTGTLSKAICIQITNHIIDTKCLGEAVGWIDVTMRSTCKQAATGVSDAPCACQPALGLRRR